MRCEGKIVLVTGAQRGIGRAVALRFAREGAHVALNFLDRDADVWIPFPAAGQWAERIDGTSPVQVAPGGQGARVRIPSNYGAVYELV